MSFPRYPKYKDSGVEWLGEVPEHWALKPLWTFFRRVKRTGFDDEQLLSVYRDYGVVPKASRDDNFNKPSDDLSVYQLVIPGDLAINKMKAWQGSVAISEHRGIVSPAYFVYEALHTASSRYLHYLMRSLRYITGYMSVSKGIRVNQWDLEPQLHSRMPLTVPPIEEQTQIAVFLDRETSKIDELVAKQRRLMDLLKEKRQAVISHAVTKGLNPDAPMKPSGDQLLGDVPEHWQVKRLRHAVQVDNGPRFPINRSERADLKGEYPYWGPTGILDFLDHYRYEGERVLIGEDGDHFNKYAVWPMTQWASGRFNVNNHAHVIASGATCLARWCYFVFLHRDICADLITQGVSRLKLRRETLSNLLIACPPLDEQLRIIAELEKVVDQTSYALRCIEDVIDLLQERRTALISAAVTGQIDVREFVASSAVSSEASCV